MPAAGTGTQSSPSTLPPQYVQLLDTCWPRVCVESADVAPGAGGHLYAHAVVQLGGLRPADVRVELVRIGAGTAAERRMFSDQSYDNGAFVFETSVARTDVSRADHWVIHVHPAEAVDEPQVEFRIPAGVDV